MQWNRPFGSYGFQNYSKTVQPIPQIVGEGDVTAITFPDGSMQFYFVPIVKPNHLPSPCDVNNPYSNLFSYQTNAEVWFVRSIIQPQANLNISVPPGYCNSQLPSTIIGECLPYPPPSYMNTYPPAYHEYIQKFHNDKLTSTTDIHYFYPSLRQTKCLQYCAETQTEIPFSNYNVRQNGESNRIVCHCKSRQNPFHTCHPQLQTKSSDMSVDNEGSESSLQKNRKYKKRSNNNKMTKIVKFCECKNKIRITSDKFVSTYADQATGITAKGGRETQTETSKRLKNHKSKAANTKPIVEWDSSGSCTCSSESDD